MAKKDKAGAEGTTGGAKKNTKTSTDKKNPNVDAATQDKILKFLGAVKSNIDADSLTAEQIGKLANPKKLDKKELVQTRVTQNWARITRNNDKYPGTFYRFSKEKINELIDGVKSRLKAGGTTSVKNTSNAGYWMLFEFESGLSRGGKGGGARVKQAIDPNAFSI
jgi:hypothetical protein